MIGKRASEGVQTAPEPMGISISFGLAFAMVLTLVVVPAIYMIVRDLQRVANRVWYGPQPEPTAAA